VSALETSAGGAGGDGGDEGGERPETGTETETVLTFGGNSRTYHVVVHPPNGEVCALCGQTGRNPMLKERHLIESHYEPCSRCYSRVGGGDGGDE
jgi:hypothetical protein